MKYEVMASQINQFADDGHCTAFVDVSHIDRRPLNPILQSPDGLRLFFAGKDTAKYYECTMESPHELTTLKKTGERDFLPGESVSGDVFNFIQET